MRPQKRLSVGQRLQRSCARDDDNNIIIVYRNYYQRRLPRLYSHSVLRHSDSDAAHIHGATYLVEYATVQCSLTAPSTSSTPQQRPTTVGIVVANITNCNVN